MKSDAIYPVILGSIIFAALSREIAQSSSYLDGFFFLASLLVSITCFAAEFRDFIALISRLIRRKRITRRRAYYARRLRENRIARDEARNEARDWDAEFFQDMALACWEHEKLSRCTLV